MFELLVLKALAGSSFDWRANNARVRKLNIQRALIKRLEEEAKKLEDLKKDYYAPHDPTQGWDPQVIHDAFKAHKELHEKHGAPWIDVNYAADAEANILGGEKARNVRLALGEPVAGVEKYYADKDDPGKGRRVATTIRVAALSVAASAAFGPVAGGAVSGVVGAGASGGGTKDIAKGAVLGAVAGGLVGAVSDKIFAPKIATTAGSETVEAAPAFGAAEGKMTAGAVEGTSTGPVSYSSVFGTDSAAEGGGAAVATGEPGAVGAGMPNVGMAAIIKTATIKAAGLLKQGAIGTAKEALAEGIKYAISEALETDEPRRGALEKFYQEQLNNLTAASVQQVLASAASGSELQKAVSALDDDEQEGNVSEIPGRAGGRNRILPKRFRSFAQDKYIRPSGDALKEASLALIGREVQKPVELLAKQTFA